MRRLFFAVLASCLLIANPASAQHSSSRNFLKDSLDSYVQKAMQAWKIPGVSIAVVKNGEWLVAKGYGVKVTGSNATVDEHTLFGIGSNTKAFTGTALAMLESQGKLSLDDKVKKWIPDFQVYDTWVTKELTIRDLVSHRMGYETFQGDFMYFDSDLSYQEVKEKFGLVKPMYGFRSRWGYTNAGFAIAGEIIQKASGQSFGEFIATQLFQPIGMKNSIANSNQYAKAPNIAAAHTVTEGVLKKVAYGNLDNMAPAGAIASSAYDMGLWAQTLLNKGELNGKRILSASAVQTPMEPHSILGSGGHPFNRAHFYLYGLGWLLQSYEGRKLVEHTGGVNGFVTSFTLIPEENIGIVVLTNTDANGFFEAMKWELVDACLGLPFRDYNAMALQQQEQHEKRASATLKEKRDSIALKLTPQLPLSAFAGTYQHEVYGKMTLQPEKGQLVARFEHHPGRFATLGSLGGNRFFASFNDPLFGNKVWPFSISDGKVKSVTVTVSDFIEFTSYEFYKQ
ncbi:serine hydrolase [Flavihumibacter sp. RY-1]|uniref:Serine hydrolase n=1 Tax=Flavihumibacter fluminis TaxID=2909236 RepID=A0ABS9BKB3_9BACT|nr:serine hydrolase [Flavihumibacter fluminis]MCF1715552.1 serine hydrolase [Flavihumibacter fluminis]